MSDLILQMATAFVNQDGGNCTADSIEPWGDGELIIHYFWPAGEGSVSAGSGEWTVTLLELIAFAWSSK
jgi:hypothetical protein